jgi:hypothetical protein
VKKKPRWKAKEEGVRYPALELEDVLVHVGGVPHADVTVHILRDHKRERRRLERLERTRTGGKGGIGNLERGD